MHFVVYVFLVISLYSLFLVKKNMYFHDFKCVFYIFEAAKPC